MAGSTGNLKVTVDGFNTFYNAMKKLSGEELYRVISEAERKALTPARKDLARNYGAWRGKHDSEQTASRLLWRWRAKKWQPIHPVGESRGLISVNIAKHQIRTRLARGGKYVWGKVFGSTQNSWLIEHGRYKDAARAYQGWNVFRRYFESYGASLKSIMEASLTKGFADSAKRLAREAAAARRAVKR